MKFALFLRPALAAAVLFGLCLPGQAQEAAGFPAFKQQIRAEALATGLSAALVDRELASVSFDPDVIRLDNRQPEHTITFAEYQDNALRGDRVAIGVAMLGRHCSSLRRVERQSGVPAEYIVALWGSETNYGRFKGNNDVLQSVINLAYAGKPGRFIDRRAMFRAQAIATLKIIGEGRYSRSALRGSYAGAFGNHQFMAQSFLAAAVDGDGDGRADIINNPVDSFASAANLLRQKGWQPGDIWGREIAYPATLPPETRRGIEYKQPLAHWRTLGLRLASGSALPEEDNSQQDVSFIVPDSSVRRAFLFYGNAHTLWRWNNSSWFVIMTETIATRIAAEGAVSCPRSPAP